MSSSVLLTCALIVVGRITDVSLGTLRVLFIVQGERLVAATLGFFEVLIWVVVVSRVVTSLDQPAYFVAYAAGFSLGTYLGMRIENRIASGRQVVRVFTRRGPNTAERLRAQGFVVTEFDGRGRDGPVHLLFLETSRRSARDVLSTVRAVDPEAYPIVDNVRSAAGRIATQPGGWRWLTFRRK
jgi:uncharacterized protein YebE (UPF0316 family)